MTAVGDLTGITEARPGSYADYDAGILSDELQVVSLSQEHGKLSGSQAVGTRLRILPNHSCLTAACFRECYAVRGQHVVDRWRVWSGR
jgi:D-serine deaminase-like pyridoxal phosphate-dependent protein